MTLQREHDDFVHRLRSLKEDPLFRRLLKKGIVNLRALSEKDIDALCRREDDAAFYFLMAAAGLSRTKLKKAQEDPGVKIASRGMRRAFALKQYLPPKCTFDAVLETAAALRAPDIGRMGSGDVERILRERLIEEGIPIAMAPPIRGVAGVLTRANRKPDGVFPDPATGLAPRVYLEIKRVNRVSDDIQKRLYEIAEVSLEMKTLYGQMALIGLNLARTEGVLENARLRGRIRKQIVNSLPVVVALLICGKAEAEPYRAGAQAFVDRVFFQEEIDECIEFLQKKCRILAPTGTNGTPRKSLVPAVRHGMRASDRKISAKPTRSNRK